jgi:hypothetical protein
MRGSSRYNIKKEEHIDRGGKTFSRTDVKSSNAKRSEKEFAAVVIHNLLLLYQKNLF